MKIKYTDGGTLKHSYFRGASSGNPWANKDGTFGTAPRYYDYDKYGSNYKFGSDSGEGPTYTYKNRYQYTKTDSSGKQSTEYTEAGKRRYAYEESVNNAKKKDNRIDEDSVGDVSRWQRDDIKNTQELIKSTQEAGKAVNNVVDLFNKPKQGKRIDLSEMSDDELRAILNREQMERTYNSYFNAPQVNKGAEIVKGVSNFITTTGTIGLSVLQAISIIRGFAGGS